MVCKKCNQCLTVKEITEFSPKGNSKFASRCKKCLAQNRRENYEKHEKVSVIVSNKICATCGLDKQITEFYKNYNCSTYRNECKTCNQDRTKESRIKVREFVIELKSKPCQDCGINYPPYVMDFDHRDGVDKEYEISQMRFFSKEEILKEVSKCDLVCSNCHRERTFQRLNKREI